MRDSYLNWAEMKCRAFIILHSLRENLGQIVFICTFQVMRAKQERNVSFLFGVGETNCSQSRTILNGSTVTIKRFEKPKVFNFVNCNPCQSSPSLTILVSLWLIVISLVFLYLCKVLFSGFLSSI